MSPTWTAKDDSQPIFNSHFWSANVTEVCLTSDIFGIQLPVQAPSLRSLFFEKTILNISTQQWLSALKINITDDLSQPSHCYETGFNVGDSNLTLARLGIVSISGSGK